MGWILLAISSAFGDWSRAPLYWTALTVGTVFLVYVLVGVVMYLMALPMETESVLHCLRNVMYGFSLASRSLANSFWGGVV